MSSCAQMPFTHSAYRNMLQILKERGYGFCGYGDWEGVGKPVILRHDIDFDPIAALAMACLLYTSRYRVAIPLCAAALLVLLGVGALRGGEFSLERIADYLSKTFESGLAWDGAYSAYHTSLAVLATEGLRSSAERLSEFPTYLATVSVWPFDVSGFLDPVRDCLLYTSRCV